MNFKCRIRSLERKFCFQLNGIEERELLNQNYKYRGTPFNSIDEMIKTLNVVELSPYYLDDQIIQFCMNGLLSHQSNEMERIRLKILEEMKRMI